MARRTATYSPDEAVSSRIESAVRAPKRPSISHDEARETQILYNPVGSAAQVAAERRAATACVRRLAPEHAVLLLDALGLEEGPDEQPGPDWYTSGQLAEQLGISLSTVRSWVTDRKVRSVLDPADPRRRLIHPASAARMIANHAPRKQAS